MVKLKFASFHPDLRSQILAAANTLFLHRGFENVTLADIADRLDISMTACMNHFSSTDELLEELWATGIPVVVIFPGRRKEVGDAPG